MKNNKKNIKNKQINKEAFDTKNIQADFDEFMKKYMSNQNKNDKLGKIQNIELIEKYSDGVVK